jgi:penicillin-binding protein-related factor A (putative recombinase)
MKWIDAEAEFISWFQTKSTYCFQFHDARQAKGAGGSNRIFTTSHPADFVVVDNGSMFYAEVKSSQEPISFPFSNVKKSQWNAAIRTTAAKGFYYFFLKSEYLNQWFRIPAVIMIGLYEDGVKSVRWEHLLPFKYERKI